MSDDVVEALRKQMADLWEEMAELKQDIYSDERRRRIGVLERAEQMEKRQLEHEELLDAFKRREDAREKREIRRGRVVNSLLGIITTILTLFAVAGLNQLFWG